MTALAIHRARSLIPEFRLLRPSDLDEAHRFLDEHPDATIMAGGLDVVTRMKRGGPPRTIIMIDRVAGLDRMALGRDRDTIEVGAMVRHDDFVRNALVREHLPDLAAAWDRIANVRIRCQGTLVGNVLACMPGYEGAALLAAASASLLTREGALPIVALAEVHAEASPIRDVVQAVSLPLPETGVTRRLVYARGLRPGLAVTLRLDHAADRVREVSAVLGGCHAWPVLRVLPAAGITLRDLAAEAPALAARAFDGMQPPTAPWSGMPGYREAMAPVLLRRLIAEAVR